MRSWNVTAILLSRHIDLRNKMYHSVEHWTEYIDGLQNTRWSARVNSRVTDVAMMIAESGSSRDSETNLFHWLMYLLIHSLIH